MKNKGGGYHNFYLFVIFYMRGGSDWNKNLKINFWTVDTDWVTQSGSIDTIWKTSFGSVDTIWKTSFGSIDTVSKTGSGSIDVIWVPSITKFSNIFLNLKVKEDPKWILINIFMVKNLISLICQKNIFRDRVPLRESSRNTLRGG